MGAAVLVINAGSSSVKFAVSRVGEQGVRVLLKGKLSRIDQVPHFTVASGEGEVLAECFWEPTGGYQPHLFSRLLEWIESHLGGEALLAVGHRVVHGGMRFTGPVIIDEQVLVELSALTPLAPLHQPHHVSAMRALGAAHPGLPQVACFDTSFHSAHADTATRLALPRALHDEGVRRYCFHGLSYEFIARELARLAPQLAHGRVVAAHLGAGTSLCAIKDGKSIDSTTGFSAVEGLPMATRTGSLDAGVILYLMEQGMGHDAIQTLIYQQSGLLGMSGGIGSDIRALLASDLPEAAQAVDSFVYRTVRDIAGMAACMGGIDGVVFTAGIGEHSVEIRRRIGDGCAWLGLDIDPEANARGTGCISAPGSRLAAWVIPTDEEQMIALHTVTALSGAAPAGSAFNKELFNA